jgi:hypothetical protein
VCGRGGGLSLQRVGEGKVWKNQANRVAAQDTANGNDDADDGDCGQSTDTGHMGVERGQSANGACMECGRSTGCGFGCGVEQHGQAAAQRRQRMDSGDKSRPRGLGPGREQRGSSTPVASGVPRAAGAAG